MRGENFSYWMVLRCRSSVASSGITGTGDQAELHFSEAWFHGNLERGRETAEQMLYENAHMGDGTFIVRKSQVRLSAVQ